MEPAERKKMDEKVMVVEAPTGQALQILLGEHQYVLSEKLTAAIKSRYALGRVWHNAGKQWIYELKSCKCSKTICVLLFGEDAFQSKVREKCDQ